MTALRQHGKKFSEFFSGLTTLCQEKTLKLLWLACSKIDPISSLQTLRFL